MISPFVRVRVSETGIFTSMCALCQLVVGSSSNPDALTIAEIAHNCRNKHLQSGDNTIAPTGTEDRLP